MRRYLAVAVSVSLLFCGTELVKAGTIVGKVKAHGVKNSADAVIYIDKIASKTFAAPKEHARFDQRNLVFHPHVLPILVGTTVDFLNSDAPEAPSGRRFVTRYPDFRARALQKRGPDADF